MQSVDLNFSGFQRKAANNDMEALEEEDIPDSKIHNADSCYADAKKLAENQLLTVG